MVGVQTKHNHLCTRTFIEYYRIEAPISLDYIGSTFSIVCPYLDPAFIPRIYGDGCISPLQLSEDYKGKPRRGGQNFTFIERELADRPNYDPTSTCGFICWKMALFRGHTPHLKPSSTVYTGIKL